MCQSDEPLPQRAGLYQHRRLLHLPEELCYLWSRLSPQRRWQTMHWYACRKAFTMQRRCVSLLKCRLSVQISTNAKIPRMFVSVTAASTCWVLIAVSVRLATSSTASVGYARVSKVFLRYTEINPIGSLCMSQSHGCTCLCKWMERCSKPWSLGISDINECRHYPGRLCAHKCENTPGSYKCSCTTGFKLASDGRNCDGNVMLDIPSGFYLPKLATHAVWHVSDWIVSVQIWTSARAAHAVKSAPTCSAPINATAAAAISSVTSMAWLVKVKLCSCANKECSELCFSSWSYLLYFSVVNLMLPFMSQT